MANSTFKYALMLSAAAGTLYLSAGSALAQDGYSFKDKAAFENAVKSYLLENPEIIFEDAFNAYREESKIKSRAEAKENLKPFMSYLTREDAPSMGNPDGDITVIEFFDYNCGYCKRAFEDIQKIVKQDDQVRFVFIDLSYMGPSSRTASMWALAAHKQGKYIEYHSGLMKMRGSKSEEARMKLGEEIGLDVEQLKKDAESEEITKQHARDMIAARDIGVEGTPAFVIGEEFIGGYIGLEGMLATIKSERDKL